MTKIDIFSGFLGAGKTTLIKKLLKEAYAGENYGGVNDGGVFTWFFGGIGSELNGAEIWCVVEDGHNDVRSKAAIITVTGTKMPPEILSMPSSMTVEKGGIGEARCVARSISDSQLEFLWYETATGRLENIQAIYPEENGDFLYFDTSNVGRRYYVCCVSSTDGGRVYSSVLSVDVVENPEQIPPQDTVLPDTGKTPVDGDGTEPLPTPSVSTPAFGDVEISDSAAASDASSSTAEKPKKTEKSDDDSDSDDDESQIPWWVLVVASSAALGAGVITAILLTHKKK